MKSVIVLAMHGSPPRDFPRNEMMEIFGLHEQLHHAPAGQRLALKARHDMLENKMRSWPRTEENDPFFFASQEIAKELGKATGCEVLVGFNEFCAPSMDETLDLAASKSPERVVVVTPMMTRGGEHAEKDIPKTINEARQRHPGKNFVYAWPFDAADVGGFLADQLKKTL